MTNISERIEIGGGWHFAVNGNWAYLYQPDGETNYGEWPLAVAQAFAAAIAGGVQQGEVRAKLDKAMEEMCIIADQVICYGMESKKVPFIDAKRKVLELRKALTPPNVSEAPKPEGE